jgi:hypothetical protein
MAISSLDGLITSVAAGKSARYDFYKQTGAGAYTAGRCYDLSLLAGFPIANTYAGTALNAVVPDETTGWGIPHGGLVTPNIKHLLNVGAGSAVATAVPGILQLVDVCMYYPGIATNTLARQTLVNGSSLTRYTTGAGLRSYVVLTAANGANAAAIDNGAGTGTEYVDQSGATSVHPGTLSLTASGIVGHVFHSGTAVNNTSFFLPLASGDTGIRSYNFFKFTAASASAGTCALVIAKPLISIPIFQASAYSERNLLTHLPSLPVIQEGACLTWLYFAGAATAASTNIFGHVEVVYG